MCFALGIWLLQGRMLPCIKKWDWFISATYCLVENRFKILCIFSLQAFSLNSLGFVCVCVVCLFVCWFVCYCYCCCSGLVGCWFLVLFCFSFGRNSFWFTYNMEHVFPSTFWLHISSHLLNISVSCKIWIVKCWNSPLFLSPSTRFWSFYKDSGPSW